MGGIGTASVKLQERDFEILGGLLHCRVMSLRHITDLYFSGKSESAKKRIQKLKAAGYVRERPRRIGDSSVLHLTKKAFAVLRENGHLQHVPNLTDKALHKRGEVSDLTLRHELQVLDVKAAIFRSISENTALSLTEFSTWPLLYQFTARLKGEGWGRKEIAVKPDGFIRIREQEGDGAFEHLFYLEVDRSTETHEILAQKAAGYLDHYQSGGMAVRFGAKAEEFRDFPFRLLMVFRNDERRNNAAERLLQNNPPIMTQVWLTTLAEVLAAPLGRIWVRPKDYLEITEGTAFDPEKRRATVYSRQAIREQFVGSRINKFMLF